MHAMMWLHAHWIALTGLAVLGWVADRFLESFATLAARSDPSEPGLKGLVDLLATRTQPGRGES